MRTGRPKVQEPFCSVRGCDHATYGKGFCRPHYTRFKRNGTPGKADIGTRMETGLPCRVRGCDRFGRTRGYCNAHYLRIRIHGSPGSTIVGPKKGHGKGGRWKNNGGYIVLSKDGKRTMEHRVVMEQSLGRSLLPGENVHHRNGVRDDNRPANLELWISNQPSGQRVEDVLAWAREVVHRYG